MAKTTKTILKSILKLIKWFSHAPWMRDPVSQHPLQHMLLGLYFILTILMCVQWYFIVVLICIFLMANDIGNIFMCLISVYCFGVAHSIFLSFWHPKYLEIILVLFLVLVVYAYSLFFVSLVAFVKLLLFPKTRLLFNWFLLSFKFTFCIFMNICSTSLFPFFSHSFTFNLPVMLYVKWDSWVWVDFVNPLANTRLLSDVFRPFAFNLITDILEFIFHFIFYFLVLLFFIYLLSLSYLPVGYMTSF